MIFRQVRDSLRRVLRTRGNTLEDAEDLIQDAFLRLQVYYQKGGEVREPEAFLVRTVLRLAKNAVRDAHLDLYAEEPPERLALIDTQPAPEEVLWAEQRLEQMHRALDAMSRRTREVFILNRVEGLSYAQVAKLSGLTIKAVERRIARAMLALSNGGHES